VAGKAETGDKGAGREVDVRLDEIRVSCKNNGGVACPNKGNCFFPKAGVCPFYVAAAFQDNIPAFL
jgi:hypothetical protein